MRVIPLLLLSFSISQMIIHQYDESIFSNVPLTINAEVNVSKNTINKTILYYRTPNQENYFILELIAEFNIFIKPNELVSK